MAYRTTQDARLQRYARMLMHCQLPDLLGHGYITCFGIVQILTSVM
jgi:hypothetical protein